MQNLPAGYHLQLVTDHQLASLQALPSLIEEAMDGGVNVVQLRDKQTTFFSHIPTAQSILL